MNQFSQQPMYQGQNSYQNQSQHQYQNQFAQQQYEPIGYVQSHYQGQLSQPTFGRQTNSIVGSPISGYQPSSNSQSLGMQQYSQPAFANNSFQSGQPVQSYASSPATAFGDVGPVIAQYGYQAGPDRQQSQNQSSMMNQGQQGMQSFSQFGGNMNASNSFRGMTPTHSNTPQNPVYQATNAYEQAGPVIAQFGGYQASSNQYGGGMR